MTEQPICRICGTPVIGEAAMDPAYQSSPSYLHKQCLTLALQVEENKRATLANAAPELLAALKQAVVALDHECCRDHAVSAKRKAQRAIARAEGGAL